MSAYICSVNKWRHEFSVDHRDSHLTTQRNLKHTFIFNNVNAVLDEIPHLNICL